MLSHIKQILIAWLLLALESFRRVVATFAWIKRLNTSVPTEGNTSELHSRQKRIADRLRAGKPSAERRAGERHGTARFSLCVRSHFGVHFVKLSHWSPSGHFLRHTHHLGHLTEHWGRQRHSAAPNVRQTWNLTAISCCWISYWLFVILHHFPIMQDKWAGHSTSGGIGQSCFRAGDAGIWVGFIF